MKSSLFHYCIRLSVSILLLWVVSLSYAQDNQAVYHTIKAGETLYRLTVTYGVSAKAIMDENPGLSAENFRAGEVIRIPAKPATDAATNVQQTTVIECKLMHRVKRKETIYSISKNYKLTEEELIAANPELKTTELKRGQVICIPYPRPQRAPIPVVEPEEQKDNATLFSENEAQYNKPIPFIKAALLLPLTSNDTRIANLMVEYYEGFLMAVDSLKQLGVPMDIYVYDTGNESSNLGHILSKPELSQMNIIFGPRYDSHLRALSDFANQHRIRLVVPFSRSQEVYSNPQIYQINTPQTYLFTEVYDHFIRQFYNPNIIILDTGDSDKTDFINGLKEALQQRGIVTHTLQGEISPETIAPWLSTDRNNIFIPTSASESALTKIIPHLTLLKRNYPYVFHLFGYPEWQTYTKDFLDSFFELDTYFYSSFYTNNLLPSTLNFINGFQRWYSKEMINSYPRYGILGFDTTFFFLNGLWTYGNALEQSISQLSPNLIQSGFKFERVNNWGGFINRKVFFVHFTRDYEVVKMDFDVKALK